MAAARITKKNVPSPKTAAATWEITGSWTKDEPTGVPLLIRSFAGFSAILTSVAMASPMMPQNMVTASRPIAARVVAAFLLLGLRKAGTPLLIASTPVSAAQPEEKARSSRKTRAKPARPWCSGLIVYSEVGACMVSPRTSPRKAPQMIMMNTPATKRYVGMAKSLPDSLTPRRFISVSSTMAATAQAVLCSTTKGMAEPRFSTPEAMDTATVRT